MRERGRNTAAGTWLVSTIVGAYLVERAGSQRDAQVNHEEHEKLAANNEHVRRGMAAALRTGLENARAAIYA